MYLLSDHNYLMSIPPLKLRIYGGKFSYMRKFIGVYTEIYFCTYKNISTFKS